MQNYEDLNIQQTVSEKDPFTEERYRLFHRYIPKNCKYILDIGCNTGRGGKILKQLNVNYVISGLDVVKERLEKLPKHVYEKNIYGLSSKIPVPDNSFDIVIAGEFIEHLYPADVDTTFYEIFRILKIGGRLLLTTPNPKDIKLRIRGGSTLGGAHVSQHHPGALKLKLNMVGFRNIKLRGSGKTTRYLTHHFPLLCVFGSYLAIADKF